MIATGWFKRATGVNSFNVNAGVSASAGKVQVLLVADDGSKCRLSLTGTQAVWLAKSLAKHGEQLVEAGRTAAATIGGE